MSDKFYIVLNSTSFYVVAFLLTTILHEFSHALVGKLFGSGPIIHHNYVEHIQSANLSIRSLVLIALAGPAFSLCQGLIAGWICLKTQKKNLVNLFLLWFSILGFNNFLGYLLTGSLFTAGDIGKVYQLLSMPTWIQIVIALIEAIALLYIAYRMTEPFLKLSYKKDWIVDNTSRKSFLFRIIILPWIFGSVIMTILYLPIIAIISIIYPIMSGFVFIYPWQNVQRFEKIELSKKQSVGKLSILTICILMVLIVVFKCLLAPGILI